MPQTKEYSLANPGIISAIGIDENGYLYLDEGWAFSEFDKDEHVLRGLKKTLKTMGGELFSDPKTKRHTIMLVGEKLHKRALKWISFNMAMQTYDYQQAFAELGLPFNPSQDMEEAIDPRVAPMITIGAPSPIRSFRYEQGMLWIDLGNRDPEIDNEAKERQLAITEKKIDKALKEVGHESRVSGELRILHINAQQLTEIMGHLTKVGLMAAREAGLAYEVFEVPVLDVVIENSLLEGLHYENISPENAFDWSGKRLFFVPKGNNASNMDEMRRNWTAMEKMLTEGGFQPEYYRGRLYIDASNKKTLTTLLEHLVTTPQPEKEQTWINAEEARAATETLNLPMPHAKAETTRTLDPAKSRPSSSK